MNEYLRSNQFLWDDWTRLHSAGSDYDIEGFRAGKNTLKRIELEELGDVSGKSLLHLQCHFGMDTLSWARLGAEVTGIDFSANAIDLARRLSEETGIAARFVQSNIYDLPDALSGRFDIVFTSYGVISWLPDLAAWGRIISHFLKPGGTFYIAEGHPFMWVFEDTADKRGIEPRWPYFQGSEPLKFDVKGSYAAPDSEYTGVEYGWNHSLSEVVDALASQGLRIEFLHEFPFLCWKAFSVMEKGEDGWWRLPEPLNVIPLMFSIKATKPAT